MNPTVQQIVNNSFVDDNESGVFYQSNYQQQVMRSCNMELEPITDPKILQLLHSLLGLCTESGEVASVMKKHLIYKKDYDNKNALEEYGDLLWYIAIGLEFLGETFFTAMAGNITKLRKRYPDAFTYKDALERADKEETGETPNE